MKLNEMKDTKLIGVGVLLIFVGLAIDTYYHAEVGQGEPTRVIMFGHVPLAIGVLVAGYGAYRGYRSSTGLRRKTMLVLTVAAGIGAFGRIFDDVFHVRNVHETAYNTFGHTVWGIGFLGLILSLVALFVLPRWVSGFSEQVADGHSSGN